MLHLWVLKLTGIDLLAHLTGAILILCHVIVEELEDRIEKYEVLNAQPEDIVVGVGVAMFLLQYF